MTSCRRRPSATRVRSVRAADWTLQRLPRLRIGPSRRHDRRVGPAPRPPQSSRRAPRSAPARRSNTCWSAGAPGPGRTGGRRADPCRPRRPGHLAYASDCRRAAGCRLIRRRCRRQSFEGVVPEGRSCMFARDRTGVAHHSGARGAREWLAAFGCGLWVGVAAGLRVVQAVAEVEHGSFGVDLGQVVEVVVRWG
jgi:hypothetical protein